MISAARNTAHLLSCPHQDCPRAVLCVDICAEQVLCQETGVNREPPPLDPSHVPSPADAKAAWIICPECGVGPGEDHRKTCGRGK